MNLPGRQETLVRSLGGEDPLEEEMAAQSSPLAWGSSWAEEPGGRVRGVAGARQDLLLCVLSGRFSAAESFLSGTCRLSLSSAQPGGV